MNNFQPASADVDDEHATQDLRTFGETLRHLRRRAGLTQEQLSHEAGLDRSYVGQVERGERNVALLNILRLSDALGVHPSALVRDLRNSEVES